MKRLLAALILFTTPAQAQEVYSGAGYEKLNFKTDERIAQSYDTMNTFTGVELGRHAFEVGAFASANEGRGLTTTRLQGISVDSYLYSNSYRNARAFLTSGTVVMDVQIDGLGNKTKIFPRGGAGLEYDLGKVAIRGTARYQSDWSYGVAVKWGW